MTHVERAQRLLGAVVGRQDGAVGEEDEQVSSAALDGVLEFFAGRMGRGGTQEIQHPRTPGSVQAAVLPQIFNLRPELIAPHRSERRRVQAILQGSALPGAHAADASHLSEAAETGCGYLITHDKRILKKRSELHAVLPPSVNIVTLEEFLDILDAYETGQL
jgi:hypothetical protein